MSVELNECAAICWIDCVEPTARIELATPSLPRMCSTTEPRGHTNLYGAGDGIRTHDIQLGRLELYQLSYTRLNFSSVSIPARRRSGGGGRIRTFEVIRRQIYSLLPLATREPLHSKALDTEGKRTKAWSIELDRLPGLGLPWPVRRIESRTHQRPIRFSQVAYSLVKSSPDQ
jgi:hypothetical protein